MQLVKAKVQGWDFNVIQFQTNVIVSRVLLPSTIMCTSRTRPWATNGSHILVWSQGLSILLFYSQNSAKREWNLEKKATERLCKTNGYNQNWSSLPQILAIACLPEVHEKCENSIPCNPYSYLWLLLWEYLFILSLSNSDKSQQLQRCLFANFFSRTFPTKIIEMVETDFIDCPYFIFVVSAITFNRIFIAPHQILGTESILSKKLQNCSCDAQNKTNFSKPSPYCSRVVFLTVPFSQFIFLSAGKKTFWKNILGITPLTAKEEKKVRWEADYLGMKCFPSAS